MECDVPEQRLNGTVTDNIKPEHLLQCIEQLTELSQIHKTFPINRCKRFPADIQNLETLATNETNVAKRYYFLLSRRFPIENKSKWKSTEEQKPVYIRNNTRPNFETWKSASDTASVTAALAAAQQKQKITATEG